MKSLLKSRRAISPVIATVILVAVAITVAVSVAYWMGGISSLYTRLEKVEISSTSVAKTGNNYSINMTVKNTGSADATIDAIYINGKSTFSGVTIMANGTAIASLSIPIPAGSSKVVSISIVPGTSPPFTAGTTLDVKIHTAAGKDYPQMVTLT
jgi:flagellin-like protein